MLSDTLTWLVGAATERGLGSSIVLLADESYDPDRWRSVANLAGVRYFGSTRSGFTTASRLKTCRICPALGWPDSPCHVRGRTPSLSAGCRRSASAGREGEISRDRPLAGRWYRHGRGLVLPGLRGHVRSRRRGPKCGLERRGPRLCAPSRSSRDDGLTVDASGGGRRRSLVMKGRRSRPSAPAISASASAAWWPSMMSRSISRPGRSPGSSATTAPASRR